MSEFFCSNSYQFNVMAGFQTINRRGTADTLKADDLLEKRVRKIIDNDTLVKLGIKDIQLERIINNLQKDISILGWDLSNSSEETFLGLVMSVVMKIKKADAGPVEKSPLTTRDRFIIYGDSNAGGEDPTTVTFPRLANGPDRSTIPGEKTATKDLGKKGSGSQDLSHAQLAKKSIYGMINRGELDVSTIKTELRRALKTEGGVSNVSNDMLRQAFQDHINTVALFLGRQNRTDFSLDNVITASLDILTDPTRIVVPRGITAPSKRIDGSVNSFVPTISERLKRNSE